MKIFYKILWLSLLLALCITPQVFAQRASSPISTQENIAESVKLAPCRNEDRFDAVKKLFARMGANDDEVSVEKFDKLLNIVVRKKGKSDEMLIVGAHYDKVDEGCGAIDNWTGITILAHLYHTFSQIATEKTIIFVAFDQEEKGLLGSEAMAKAIPKDKRSQYCAMVNLDSFGIAAPQTMRNVTSQKLAKLAGKMAKETNFPYGEASIFDADADSHSFMQRDIPAITFHGLDANWQNYLHSTKDKVEKISMLSVYAGYRFALGFVAKLDGMICKELK